MTRHQNELEMETETRKLKAANGEHTVSKLNLRDRLLDNMPIGTGMNVKIENEALKTAYNYPGIIGSSLEMQKVYRLMSMVASCDSTVLLLGETGTGKEAIARAIHGSSYRKCKPLVTVNCAALPANLIESELFGHERGSFTGAFDRRIGKFELAHQGTIFLDEIGELPMDLQVKLLRVLQEREFERIGGKTSIKVNVRIIAATNRDLEKDVNERCFRPDLYYRLNVFPITLPPLRDRLDDIAPLSAYFLSHYSKITGRKVNGISCKALQQLRSYTWPGNVRELEHFIERSVLLSNGSILNDIDLPPGANKSKNELEIIKTKTLYDVERQHIIEVLKRCSGKISGDGGAAVWLDLPATTVHSKMKKLNIQKQDYFSKVA